MEGCLEFVHVSGLKACARNPGVWKSLRPLKQLYKPEPRLTEWSQTLWSPSLLFSSVGPAASRCLETLSSGRGTSPQGPAQSWKPPPGSLLPWASASSWDLSFTFCRSALLSLGLCLLEKINAGICVLCLWPTPLPHSFQKSFACLFLRWHLARSNLWTTVILLPQPRRVAPTALPGLAGSWDSQEHSHLRVSALSSSRFLILSLWGSFPTSSQQTGTPSCHSHTPTHPILFLRHA